MENNEKKQTNAEKAFEIFEKEAAQRGRNYFGDLVKENLTRMTSNGMSPQEAVNALWKRANRRR